ERGATIDSETTVPSVCISLTGTSGFKLATTFRNSPAWLAKLLVVLTIRVISAGRGTPARAPLPYGTYAAPSAKPGSLEARLYSLTSPVTPTTVVVHSDFHARFRRFPIGFWFGQNFRAVDAVTSATGGASGAMSAAVNSRPRSNGIPISRR